MTDTERPAGAWDPAPQQPTPEAAPHPAYAPPTEQAPPPQAQADASEERQWALFAHLSALAGLVLPTFGNILGPLLVWAIGKDKGPFIDDQGKEALNFQITVLLVELALGALLVVGLVLSVILIGIPIMILAGIGLAVVAIGSLILAVVGGIKANEGVWYRYPFTLRMVK